MILVGLLVALAGGVVVEYAVHRAMHNSWRKTWLGRFHMEHHAAGESKPLWQEMLMYQVAPAVIGPLGLVAVPFLGWEFFCAWVAGGVLYAAAVGARHWYDHAHGSEFHRRHHAYPRTNYGVLTGVVDWALGTSYETAARKECGR